ncbi:MAG: hypothetical protein AAF585_17755 [Verrucomicrobiota bacterium]
MPLKHLILLAWIPLAFCSCKTTTSLIESDNTDGWSTVNEGGRWTVEKGVMSGEKDAHIDHHCLLISDQPAL